MAMKLILFVILVVLAKQPNAAKISDSTDDNLTGFGPDHLGLVQDDGVNDVNFTIHGGGHVRSHGQNHARQRKITCYQYDRYDFEKYVLVSIELDTLKIQFLQLWWIFINL